MAMLLDAKVAPRVGAASAANELGLSSHPQYRINMTSLYEPGVPPKT